MLSASPEGTGLARRRVPFEFRSVSKALSVSSLSRLYQEGNAVLPLL